MSCKRRAVFFCVRLKLMRLVLTRPALAAELRVRGLARAAPFTWQRTARETIAVYERVLAGRGTVIGER